MTKRLVILGALAAALVGASAGLLQQYPPPWAVRPSASVGWTDPYNPKIVLTFEKTVGQLANQIGAPYSLGLIVSTNCLTVDTNSPALSPGNSFFFSNVSSRFIAYTGAVLHARPCYAFENYSDYTISFWFNSVTTTRCWLAWEAIGGGGEQRYFDNLGTTFTFNNNFGVSGKGWRGAAGMWTTNVWHHFVGVVNGTNSTTTGYCWLNGTNIAVTQHSFTNIWSLGRTISNWASAKTSGRLFIGTTATAGGAANSFDKAFWGYLKDIRIWNRMLTAVEITNVYLGSPPTNALQYYYPLTQMVDRTEFYLDRWNDQPFFSHSGTLGYEPFYLADPLTTGAVSCIESVSADYYNIVCSNLVPGTLSTGFLFACWVSQKMQSAFPYVFSLRSNGVSQCALRWNGTTSPENAFVLKTPSGNAYAASNTFGAAYMTNWQHLAVLYTPSTSNNLQFWINATNFVGIVVSMSNSLGSVNELVLLNNSYDEQYSFGGSIYGPRLYYPPPFGDMNVIVSQIYANASSPYNPTNEVFP